MSIFGSIVSKIFGHASASPAPTPGMTTASAAPSPGASSVSVPPSEASAPAPSASAFNNPPAATPAPGDTAVASPAAAPAATPSTQPVDVAAVLNEMLQKNGQKLDWKHSIVDLMKLLGLDSSLSARQELAKELDYSGSTSDSATMNIWLHKEVMQKLAANGGKVPEELRT